MPYLTAQAPTRAMFRALQATARGEVYRIRRAERRVRIVYRGPHGVGAGAIEACRDAGLIVDGPDGAVPVSGVWRQALTSAGRAALLKIPT